MEGSYVGLLPETLLAGQPSPPALPATHRPRRENLEGERPPVIRANACAVKSLDVDRQAPGVRLAYRDLLPVSAPCCQQSTGRVLSTTCPMEASGWGLPLSEGGALNAQTGHTCFKLSPNCGGQVCT